MNFPVFHFICSLTVLAQRILKVYPPPPLPSCCYQFSSLIRAISLAGASKGGI